MGSSLPDSLDVKPCADRQQERGLSWVSVRNHLQRPLALMWGRLLGNLRLCQDLPALMAPAVTITLSGEQGAAERFHSFTSPHRRYFIIQRKKWGVALLLLPSSFDTYLQGRSRQALRSKRKRCLSEGYYFAQIDPNSHFEEILAINTSLKQRQGCEMERDYVKREALRDYYSIKRTSYAVMDSAGIVRAYAYVPVFGEVFILDRLLGHGDHLERGVMYLLVSEIVREMIRTRQERGEPKWGMYDMIFGSRPGL